MATRITTRTTTTEVTLLEEDPQLPNLEDHASLTEKAMVPRVVENPIQSMDIHPSNPIPSHPWTSMDGKYSGCGKWLLDLIS